MSLDLRTALVIFAAGLATYLTRIGGYWLLSNVKNLPPRLETALNAVPAAVLTTLVAPAFFDGGIELKLAMIVAMIVGLRHNGIPLILAGWGSALIMRHFIMT